MTLIADARDRADRSHAYLRSYSTDLRLAQHALDEGDKVLADHLIKQAHVSMCLALDLIDEAARFLAQAEAMQSDGVVIPFPAMAHTPREKTAGADSAFRRDTAPTVLTGLTTALLDIADRYDPRPPCDTEPMQ